MWLAVVGCRADLPPGWAGAHPVDDLVQSPCEGSLYDTGIPSEVSAALDADPLQVEATRVQFRCEQEVEGFWKQRGGRVEVLVQPIDMHPGAVAKCDCPYDLDITVGSPDPRPDEVIVWRRWDDLNDPNPPVEVGRDVRGACDARSGGALVTIQVVAETFTFWSTDDAFVDAAIADLATGSSQLPLFGQVVAGTDCDPQWSWHVDAADMAWADFAIELCDGLPSHIEADPAAWIDQVGSWCPWAGTTIAVDDRR